MEAELREWYLSFCLWVLMYAYLYCSWVCMRSPRRRGSSGKSARTDKRRYEEKQRLMLEPERRNSEWCKGKAKLHNATYMHCSPSLPLSFPSVQIVLCPFLCVPPKNLQLSIHRNVLSVHIEWSYYSTVNIYSHALLGGSGVGWFQQQSYQCTLRLAQHYILYLRMYVYTSCMHTCILCTCEEAVDKHAPQRHTDKSKLQ